MTAAPPCLPYAAAAVDAADRATRGFPVTCENGILASKNMTARSANPREVDMPDHEATPLAARAVRRALAPREAVAHEEVRRLLDAALEVMRESGTSPPKVADIVAASGLSNQTFYRHFAGRDDLVAAVVEAGALRLVDYVDHQMGKAAPDDSEGRVRIWIESVLSQSTRPAVAQATRAVMWNFRQLPRDGGPGDRWGGVAALLLQPLRAMGSPDPPRDAEAIAELVFGRLEHHLWVVAPTTTDVEHLVGFCLRAVRR
jgi:AcrR family transcriptional regulator